MKHIHPKRFLPHLGLSLILLTTACTDKWNDHYNEETFDLPDKTLMEYILEDSELSTFADMLKAVHYDVILNASQSYTVWAPNNAALSGVDTNNTELVLEILRNHIARSRYSTSGIDIKAIRMLNGKYINFEREAAGFKFGNSNIIDINIPVINGLLHTIDGYNPFERNLWEFIERIENLDSLYTYLDGQSQYVFDPINSVEIGVNDNGQPVFDTSFIFSNPILNKIGAIDMEDSIYTAIMPDNEAWDEAYNRTINYFNFPDDAGGNLRKHKEAQYTIVKDMVIEGVISEPASLDSLVTTTGNVYYNPGYLFENAEKHSLSNGLGFVTSQMPFSDTASWFKEIRIEAEEQEGRLQTNCNIFERSSYGTPIKASDNGYILVDPTAPEPSVEFTIPNTLSATYNIYCVFVPASIVDPFDLVPTKAKFDLTYIRRINGSVFHHRVTPDINITIPFGLTKMYVDQFEFEFANVANSEFERDVVKLEVINVVSDEEEQLGTFSRTMRIDCIILEPVIQ